MSLARQNRDSRAGASAVEFALVAVLFLLPLILGCTSFGLNLVRGIQVTQLNRDAGHLFSRGVDFSITQNQAMLMLLKGNLNLTATTGDGRITLSAIQCISSGQAVCTRQIVVGNAGLRGSAFSHPTLVDSSGNVDFTRDSGASANAFLSVLPMSAGEVAYVAETYFTSPGFDIPGFRTNTGVYVRAIF